MYERRKAIGDPVIGQIKHATGFRQFRLRGHPNVRAGWLLVSAGHNLKKLLALYEQLSKNKSGIPLHGEPPGVQEYDATVYSDTHLG
jgi:hypothetical protein